MLDHTELYAYWQVHAFFVHGNTQIYRKGVSADVTVYRWRTFANEGERWKEEAVQYTTFTAKTALVLAHINLNAFDWMGRMHFNIDPIQSMKLMQSL